MDIAPPTRRPSKRCRRSRRGASRCPGRATGAWCLVPGGDGRPLAVVRTTDVRVGPLSSADDRFAQDEGEGDRTRARWLDAHTRFFSRQCTAMCLTFSGDIGVVFERFELIWPDQDPNLGVPAELTRAAEDRGSPSRIAPSQP
ncbi:MAG TPA: ASCH domain-containing protein [Streptosporangiaceae bacterium]|nr:ASCH domain-containing protein [Streptosporangiaceae bacterium]